MDHLWITLMSASGFNVKYLGLFSYVLVLLGSQAAVVSSHRCEVLVYNGVKKADCIKLNLDYLPDDLGHDIKDLTYSGNTLTYLGIDFFKDYLSLQDIILNDDQIEEIAPDAFRGLSNLQSLDLGGNHLKEVPSDSFQHLKSLRMIIFKGNPITYITQDAFADLPTIEEIDFENCHLTRIHPQAFQNLASLTDINLVNNELKTLDWRMEKYFPPQLNVFRLYRNPWDCDCNLRWLRDWISRTTVNWNFASNTPACSTPGIIRSIKWKLLKSERFACASRIIANTSTGLEIEPGQNLTIECLITGDPVPMAYWFKSQDAITHNSPKYTITFTGKNPLKSTLTVWNITPGDIGNYKCVAKNIAGRSEITYKLSLQGITEQGPATESGMPLESILAITAGVAIFILIMLFGIIYGYRRQDRRNHAYRVRDYKKPPKNKKDNNKKKKKTTNIDLEKMGEKSTPTVTTELLPDKPEKVENHVKEIKDKEKEPMMNHANHHDPKLNPEFKMKLFAFDEKKPPQEQTNLEGAMEMEETEIDPLCDQCDASRSAGSPREVTPDLLHNHGHDPLKESPGPAAEKDKKVRVENPYSTLPSRSSKDSSRKPKSKESASIPPPPPPPVHYYMNRENLENAARDKTLNKKEKKSEGSKGGGGKEHSKQDSGPGDKVASPLKGILKVTTPGPIAKDVPETTMNGAPGHREPRVPLSQSMTDNMKQMANHGPKSPRDDCNSRYMTLPARSGSNTGTGAASRSPTKSRHMASTNAPYAIAGTLPNQYHTGPAKTSSPCKAQIPLRSLENSPTKAAAHRTGPASSLHNVPIVKVPSTDSATLGRKDSRTLIIPAPPIVITTGIKSPTGQRSPASGSRSPASSQSSSAGSRDTMSPPPPKKPPRTFAATMEYLEETAEARNLLTHGNLAEGPPKPGEKDDFGTAV